MAHIPQQRIVIGMIDGFGTDYFAAQPMPALEHMAQGRRAATT